MNFLIAEKQYQRFFPVKKQRFQEKEKMWLLDFSFKFIYTKFIKKTLLILKFSKVFIFNFKLKKSAGSFQLQVKPYLHTFSILNLQFPVLIASNVPHLAVAFVLELGNAIRCKHIPQKESSDE